MNVDTTLRYRALRVRVIAHRLTTIRNATRISVIENGKISECGTHTELMTRRGRALPIQHAALMS